MRRTFRVLLALLGLSVGLAQAEVALEGRTLLNREDDRVVWRVTFPPAMGTLVDPVTFGGNSYVGVGPAVYAVSAEGDILGRADLPGRVYVAELDLDGILSLAGAPDAAASLSGFPAATQDVSLVVGDDVVAGDVRYRVVIDTATIGANA